MMQPSLLPSVCLCILLGPCGRLTRRVGSTTIHTTVLGNCTATDSISGGVFTSSSALLELKSKTWGVAAGGV